MMAVLSPVAYLNKYVRLNKPYHLPVTPAGGVRVL